MLQTWYPLIVVCVRAGSWEEEDGTHGRLDGTLNTQGVVRNNRPGGASEFGRGPVGKSEIN